MNSFKPFQERTFEQSKETNKYKALKANNDLVQSLDDTNKMIENNDVVSEKTRVLLKNIVKNSGEITLNKEFNLMLDNQLKSENLNEDQTKQINELRDKIQSTHKTAIEAKKADKKSNSFLDVGNLVEKARDTAKEKFNLASLAQGALHGAGVGLDMPALNILATMIDTPKKGKSSEEALAEYEKEASNVDDEPKEVIQPSKIITEPRLEPIKNENLYQSKGEGENGLDDSLLTVGSMIENVIVEGNKENISQLVKMNKGLDDMFFFMKDSADDNKEAISVRKDSIVGNVLPTEKPEEDDEPGFNFKNKSLNKILTKGTMVAAAGMAGFAIGDWLNEQMGQKTASSIIAERGLVGAVEDSGEGLLYMLGLKDDKPSKLKSLKPTTKRQKAIFGEEITKDKSDDFMDKMEDEGVIETSMFGDDKIKDITKLFKLTPNEINAIMNNGDWSDKDYNTLQKAYMATMKGNKRKYDLTANNEKAISLAETKESETSITSQPVNNTKEIRESISNIKTSETTPTQQVVVQQEPSQPVIVQQPTENRMAQYNIQDNDLVETLTLKGVRL